ncbi:hypothetical protein OROGR_022711 [Orobanche gracilis]
MAREQSGYPRTGHIGEQNRENSLQFSPLAINWIANDAAYGLHGEHYANHRFVTPVSILGRTLWDSLVYQMILLMFLMVSYSVKRGCLAAYEMLQKFRTICVSGYSVFVSPSRDALCSGEIIMVYLSRCAHTNPEVRKTSVQCRSILDLFFSIPLSLPRSANSSFGLDIELCYSALSALEDVITILRNNDYKKDGMDAP